MRIIKVGVCGVPYAISRLTKDVDVIEIQKTFYKLPKLETASSWREKVKRLAELTLKAPQLVTHPPTSPTYRKAKLHIPPDSINKYGYFRPTYEVMKAKKEFLEFAKIAGAKILVFQTPPSFSENDNNIRNLEKFFSDFPNDNFILCWEPRGKWNRDTLRDLFKTLGIVHIVDPFKDSAVTEDVYYFRLHGLAKGYRYTYNSEELTKLYKILPKEGKVYVLFNNTDMYRNALEFKQIVTKI